jgi:hypothetical protein
LTRWSTANSPQRMGGIKGGLKGCHAAIFLKYYVFYALFG